MQCLHIHRYTHRSSSITTRDSTHASVSLLCQASMLPPSCTEGLHERARLRCKEPSPLRFGMEGTGRTHLPSPERHCAFKVDIPSSRVLITVPALCLVGVQILAARQNRSLASASLGSPGGMKSNTIYCS